MIYGVFNSQKSSVRLDDIVDYFIWQRYPFFIDYITCYLLYCEKMIDKDNWDLDFKLKNEEMEVMVV